MRVLALVALLAAAPARSQDGLTPTAADFAGMTPESALAALWSEALGGATATTWALRSAAYEDSTGAALPAPERLVGVRRELMTAVQAAAASSSRVSDVLHLTFALADPADHEPIFAALGEDAFALHLTLITVAEEAGTAVLTPTAAEFDATGVRESWDEWSAVLRSLVGRVEEATASLGIADEMDGGPGEKDEE